MLGLEEVDLSISIDAIAKNATGLSALLLSLVLARGSAVLNRASASASVGDWDQAHESLASIATRDPSTVVAGGSGSDGSGGGSDNVPNLNFGPPHAPGGRQVLSSLRLRGLTHLSTRTVKSFFSQYQAGSHLTSVHLAGCIGVGASAIKALVGTCGANLRYLSVEFTDMGAAGFEAIVGGCPVLEVLKASRVEGLGDHHLLALLDRVEQRAGDARPPFHPLTKLHTLKLASTEVGDAGANRLIRWSQGSLTNLNLAHTHVAPKGDLSPLGAALGLPG